MGKVLTSHIMETWKIDEDRTYNPFNIGKTNREINAVSISHT